MKTRTTWLVALGLVSLPGCGLEQALQDLLIPEPGPPEGSLLLEGTIDDLGGQPQIAIYKAGGEQLTDEVATITVDLSSSPVRFEAFILPVDTLHNLRVVATASEVTVKAIVAAPSAEATTTVPTLGADSSALALALEARMDGSSGPLAAQACDTVEAFQEELAADLASGGGAITELRDTIQAEIDAGATSFPAVVRSAADLSGNLAGLATAAAASATLSQELDPDWYRVYMGVVFKTTNRDHYCTARDPYKWVNPDPGDHMFWVGGIHEDSPVQDPSIQNEIFPNWVPNQLPMYDDGTFGDEVAGDDVWTLSFVLPRGMRIGYKYTWGAQGELWTGTEEWPGNQRIFEVVDVNGDGIVARLDVFGDESSNKDKSNQYPGAPSVVTWDTDLDGDEALEAQEQPVNLDFDSTCSEEGFWQPRSLPPATTGACF